MQGIHATRVTVEVSIGIGINFYLVGLPDNAVKESHQRIDTALKQNGYKIPGKQITVNIAPTFAKKARLTICASPQASGSQRTNEWGILG